MQQLGPLCPEFDLNALLPDLLTDPRAALNRLVSAPQAPGLDLLLGWCLLELQRKEAPAVLTLAQAQLSGSPLPAFLLGRWSESQDDSETALQYYLAAWQQAPAEIPCFAALLRAMLKLLKQSATAQKKSAADLLESTLQPILSQTGKYPQLLGPLWHICLEQGLEPGPRLVKQFILGCPHNHQAEQMREWLSELMRRQPERLYLRLNRACLLPTLYQSEAEIQVWQTRCLQELQATMSLLEQGGEAAWAQLCADWDGLYLATFLFAYQGQENRPIYDLLGDFWQQLLIRLVQPRPVQRSNQPGLRIGLASAYFYDHSIGQAFVGLIRFLHQQGVEVLVFVIGPLREDRITAQLPEVCSQLIELPAQLKQAASLIQAARPDVLIYPEIGIDFGTYLLAAMRLAPIQMMLCGHPETSGLPTIDYYVSSTGCETDQGAAHYRETLLTLDHVVTFFQPPVLPPPATRLELGLPPDLETAHLYICPMPPFKLHPENDHLFLGILQADPQAWILLFEFGPPEVRSAVRSRLERHLGKHFQRLYFLPSQPLQTFHQLLRQSDVCLDSRGFGGGTTANQALGLGVPMLIWPGEYCKQRVLYQVLEQLQLPELVAGSAQEYIQKAVRIASNPVLRQSIRNKLKQGMPQIWSETAGARQLLEFCYARTGKTRT